MTDETINKSEFNWESHYNSLKEKYNNISSEASTLRDKCRIQEEEIRMLKENETYLRGQISAYRECLRLDPQTLSFRVQ